MSVIWEEPAPAGRRKDRPPTDWIALLQPLIDEPGRWARVKTYKHTSAASAVASRLKKGYFDIPPGDFEVVTRKLESGEFGVFVRYLNGAAS